MHALFDSEVDRHSLSPYNSTIFLSDNEIYEINLFPDSGSFSSLRVKLSFIDSTNSPLDDSKATREARGLQAPKTRNLALNLLTAVAFKIF